MPRRTLARGPGKVIDFGCSHAGVVPATTDKKEFQIGNYVCTMHMNQIRNNEIKVLEAREGET